MDSRGLTGVDYETHYRAEDLKDRAVLVHFRESVETPEDGPPIAFDYRLRPGIATSTNALRLMEIMGLALPEED